MNIAKGTFEVKLHPLDSADVLEGVALGRMSIDKVISGDLVATTKGQMLSAITETEGSAGYVAIERVIGRLHGKEGSFVLQHNGIMDEGQQQLHIIIVPDSGSGELAGIRGVFKLNIEHGAHFYELTYSIPENSAS